MTPLIIAALMLASALLGGVLRNPVAALFSRNPGRHHESALRRARALSRARALAAIQLALTEVPA